MPSINLKNTIVLELSHEEFRLVGLALANNTLKFRNRTQALELNVKLTELRAQQMSDQLSVVQGAYLRAQEALNAAQTEPLEQGEEDAD